MYKLIAFSYQHTMDKLKLFLATVISQNCLVCVKLNMLLSESLIILKLQI